MSEIVDMASSDIGVETDRNIKSADRNRDKTYNANQVPDMVEVGSDIEGHTAKSIPQLDRPKIKSVSFGRKTPRQSAKSAKLLNPYQNTEMPTIIKLRNFTRSLPKTFSAPQPDSYREPIAVEHDDVQESIVDNRIYKEDFERQDHPREYAHHITFPPLPCKQRYSDAKLRSVYLPEDSKRKRSKCSSKASKTRIPVCEVAGGSLLTYTGVQEPCKETQERHLERLSVKDVTRVADNQRTVSRVIREKCGLTASFQWTAAGQRCHGFMW